MSPKFICDLDEDKFPICKGLLLFLFVFTNFIKALKEGKSFPNIADIFTSDYIEAFLNSPKFTNDNRRETVPIGIINMFNRLPEHCLLKEKLADWVQMTFNIDLEKKNGLGNFKAKNKIINKILLWIVINCINELFCRHQPITNTSGHIATIRGILPYCRREEFLHSFNNGWRSRISNLVKSLY